MLLENHFWLKTVYRGVKTCLEDTLYPTHGHTDQNLLIYGGCCDGVCFRRTPCIYVFFCFLSLLYCSPPRGFGSHGRNLTKMAATKSWISFSSFSLSPPLFSFLTPLPHTPLSFSLHTHTRTHTRARTHSEDLFDEILECMLLRVVDKIPAVRLQVSQVTIFLNSILSQSLQDKTHI